MHRCLCRGPGTHLVHQEQESARALRSGHCLYYPSHRQAARRAMWLLTGCTLPASTNKNTGGCLVRIDKGRVRFWFTKTGFVYDRASRGQDTGPGSGRTAPATQWGGGATTGLIGYKAARCLPGLPSLPQPQAAGRCGALHTQVPARNGFSPSPIEHASDVRTKYGLRRKVP
jgi:hypothetical protein